MTDQMEAMFAQLQKGAFGTNDPNTVAQELPSGSGNMQPSSWYNEYGMGTSVGVGWMPNAFPIGYAGTFPLSSAIGVALAANGGSVAIPFIIAGHMRLQDAVVWNTDTASERKWNWHLFAQKQDLGLSSDATLTRIAYGTADETFTASVASARTIIVASAPVYLAPGVHWLIVQNTHATNTFGIGGVGTGSISYSSAQTKTLTNPIAGDIDFVAATWTKYQDRSLGVMLEGRVFGQSTAF